MRKIVAVWTTLSLCALGLAVVARDVDAQVIRLKLSHYLPPKHNHHMNVLRPWVEEIRRKTNGRVEITIFPAASLCKPPQQYECARSGIADIAFGVPGWTPGRFPMTSVLELPFLYRTAAVGSQMLADLWPRYLKKEYDDVHVLYLNAAPAFHVHTRSKLVRSLADFKGLKIRVPSAVVGDILDAFGATKVGMEASQIYESMSQGVIDGFILTFEALLPFRLHEVSKYHTEVGMSTIVFATFMNKAKYESLPPDIRKVFDETTSPAAGAWRRVGESWDKAEKIGRKVVLDRKHQIYALPKEEFNRWREAAKGIDGSWASALESKGLPGRALVREARGLAVKYGEAE